MKHLDETWLEEGGSQALAVGGGDGERVVGVPHPSAPRNAAVVLLLVGRTLQGILCSDRWRAYDGLPLLQRQIGWAHLKRNWEN